MVINHYALILGIVFRISQCHQSFSSLQILLEIGVLAHSPLEFPSVDQASEDTAEDERWRSRCSARCRTSEHPSTRAAWQSSH
jgi:hypothetical protein